ncbi:hypothetical protein K4K49_005285 [Colletotrichum sp. SAR 10_70]|nr:hypothetical protein K4K50_004794 [Colletotrichum sp. SAR 10_71]KAI8167574.1 hypothetical protein K4K49_005285 [Colletotrichum sp. SAR 10_70]KAI8203238.1 hypothetical protein K4K52_005637 [Colletotrichum sp. SAR 10_76]
MQSEDSGVVGGFQLRRKPVAQHSEEHYNASYSETVPNSIPRHDLSPELEPYQSPTDFSQNPWRINEGGYQSVPGAEHGTNVHHSDTRNIPSHPVLMEDSMNRGLSPNDGAQNSRNGHANFISGVLTPSSGSSTAGASDDRRDLSPKISEKQDPKPDGDLLLSWNATFLAWWQELIWCAISLISVCALYILLRHYDNKKLPDWPSGLTLNTVIALLATVARSAFVIPVSEGLSQLKWLWYRKQRTLKDFQDFDAASRGPWGSLQLVKTTKGWPLSVISMVVLVTAMLTSALTQSSVTYPERQVAILPSSPVARLVRFWNPMTVSWYSPYIKGATYDASIQAGLSHDSNTLYPFDQPGCPTTECRWRVFSTLAICTKMWNMTDQLTYNYNGNSSRFVNTGTPRSLSLPNGALANFAPSLTGLVSLNNGQASLLPAAEVPQSAFFNFTVIFTTTKTTGAMEVMFYMCAQRYNVSVQNNVFSRTLIHSSAEVEEGTFLMPESTTSKEQVEVTTEAVTVPQEPGVAFPYGGTALTPLIESLSSAMNGTYPTTENERGRAPSRYLNVLDVVRRERNGTEKQLFEAVGNVTNNVARSLTNSLRDSLTTEQAYITGQAYVSETYVKVRWWWMTLISCQVVLSTVVLVAALIQARMAGLNVVKSSTFPAFFAIDSSEKKLLETRTASMDVQEQDRYLGTKGLGQWRLRMQDNGWVLLRVQKPVC